MQHVTPVSFRDNCQIVSAGDTAGFERNAEDREKSLRIRCVRQSMEIVDCELNGSYTGEAGPQIRESDYAELRGLYAQLSHYTGIPSPYAE